MTGAPADEASPHPDRPSEWNETWALALAFGLASVPWTYAFVAGLHLPLWPSFVASASFFAAGGGLDGLVRGYFGNLAGIGYAVATILVTGAVGGGPVALSFVVGAFMLLASLHAFVAGLHLPLWPSFVASASFFAAGGGLDGLVRGYFGNLAGIGYAVATILVTGAVGGGPVTLSFVVGAFMLLAGLHAFVPRLDFTPGAFFGYATMFGVHAAGAGAFGLTGLAGEGTAAVVAMLLGACIGLAVERTAGELA